MSARSVVAMLFTTRVSVRVGAMTSAGGVVKLIWDGFARSFPTTSWTSFASGVIVAVYVRSAGSGELNWTENEVSAVVCVNPHEFGPAPTTMGSLVAGLLSVRLKSVGSKPSAVQYTGSENVNVTVVEPTAPAADTSVGGVVSGAVATVDRVCGPSARLPFESANAIAPSNVSVLVTRAPFGAAKANTIGAVVTPLLASALQNGNASATGGAIPPLIVTCHCVGLKKLTRHTGLLNVANTRFPDAVIDMNTGRAFGSGGMSQKIETEPSP